MPVETRYFRSDQQTVNGLTAYILGITESALERSAYQYSTVSYFQWGIRVWKRASDGTETEITAGTPVATVARTEVGEGMQSNTWTCPATSLQPTDAIVVRVYIYRDGAWYLAATFITEQLNAQSLDAATWTVYYYTSIITYGTGFRGLFYWGIFTRTSPYNSRIAGFTWTEYAPPVARRIQMDGLTVIVT